MGALSDKARQLAAQAGDARPVRQAPEDRGERLATIPRGDSEELRVTWDSYEGRPYLSLRLWTRGTDGQWWPDRAKGCTVRRHELSTFADAVERAVERALAAPNG